MSEENPTNRLCENCEERVATKYAIDPYIDELYEGEDNPEKWWCDECYEEQIEHICH